MNETKWRLYWRWAKTGLANQGFLVRGFADAKHRCDFWNADDGDRCINWIQPDGTEPALKDGKEPILWRVHWREKATGHLGQSYFTRQCRFKSQSMIDGFGETDREYWIQPEPAEAAKPEPAKAPEANWRSWWRYPDGEVGFPIRAHTLDEAKEFCECWNRLSSTPGAFYWYQPEGTEPTLKGGTEPVRWRVWYQGDGDTPRSCTIQWARREGAQKNADRCNEVGRATYWIQPEPAERKAVEAKPEPAPVELNPGTLVRINGIDAHVLTTTANTSFGGWGIDVSATFCTSMPASKAKVEPKPERYTFWKVNVRDGSRTAMGTGRASDLARLSLGLNVEHEGYFRFELEPETKPAAPKPYERRTFWAAPKPYERRWKFLSITNSYGQLPFTVRFSQPNGPACVVANCQTLTQAHDEAGRLIDTDAKMGDEAIDAVFAGQK